MKKAEKTELKAAKKMAKAEKLQLARQLIQLVAKKI
jgi:hypothetical protein